MIIIKFFQSIIWLVTIPYILGMFLNSKSKKNSILYTIVVGTLIQMGTFFIISVPMILLREKFNVLRNVYFAIIVTMCIISILIYKKKLISFPKLELKSISVFQILAIFLVVIQVFIKVKYTTINNDDSSFVVLSAQMIETGNMYYSENESLSARRVLAPISAYYATISQYLFTHVTIVTHTVIPILFTVLANIVYYELGKVLFKKDKDSPYIFLIFLTLANFYMFRLKGAGSYFIRFTWLGRSIVAGILLPLFWKVSLEAMNKEKNQIKDWITILFIVLASCLCSEMSIVIVTIPIAIMALISAIRDKKISYLFKSLITVIPCFIIALIYINIR